MRWLKIVWFFFSLQLTQHFYWEVYLEENLTLKMVKKTAAHSQVHWVSYRLRQFFKCAWCLKTLLFLLSVLFLRINFWIGLSLKFLWFFFFKIRKICVLAWAMRNLGQTLAIRSDQEHSYQHLLLHWESFVFLQGIKKDLHCLLLLINSYIVLFKDQTV